MSDFIFHKSSFKKGQNYDKNQEQKFSSKEDYGISNNQWTKIPRQNKPIHHYRDTRTQNYQSKYQNETRFIQKQTYWKEDKKKSYYQEDEKLSKGMVRLLRHDIHNHNIKVSPSGYVAVEDILAISQFSHYNEYKIQLMVQNQTKKRFDLIQKQGKYYIRANWGHTTDRIEDNKVLERIYNYEDYPVVVFPTDQNRWNQIQENKGLTCPDRNHFRFFTSHPEMYDYYNIDIEINMQKCVEDDMPMYLTQDNKLTTPGINGIVNQKYFTKVKDFQGNILFYNKGFVSTEKTHINSGIKSIDLEE